MVGLWGGFHCFPHSVIFSGSISYGFFDEVTSWTALDFRSTGMEVPFFLPCLSHQHKKTPENEWFFKMIQFPSIGALCGPLPRFRECIFRWHYRPPTFLKTCFFSKVNSTNPGDLDHLEECFLGIEKNRSDFETVDPRRGSEGSLGGLGFVRITNTWIRRFILRFFMGKWLGVFHHLS